MFHSSVNKYYLKINQPKKSEFKLNKLFIKF